MRNRILWLAIITFMFGSHPDAMAVPSSANPPRHDLDFVLNWFPKDTQNFTVVRAPLTYYRENCQPIDPESMFEFPIVRPILWPPDKAWTVVKWIEPKDVSWCAHTFDSKLKNYCVFGMLTNDTQRDKSVSATMHHFADAEFEVHGYRVYKFLYPQCDPHEPPREEYKSFVAPGLLVCSNHKKYITEILGNGIKRQALQPALVEWEDLDTGASYWGVWHFTPEQQKQIEDVRSVGYNFSYKRDSRLLNFKYFTHDASGRSPKITRVLTDCSANVFVHDQLLHTRRPEVHVHRWTFARDKSGVTYPLSSLGPVCGGLPGCVEMMRTVATGIEEGVGGNKSELRARHQKAISRCPYQVSNVR